MEYKRASNEELNKIFRLAFNAKININDDMSKSELPEWDSINHLNLIVELEDYYDIKFTTDEIETITSIREIKTIIANKIL